MRWVDLPDGHAVLRACVHDVTFNRYKPEYVVDMADYTVAWIVKRAENSHFVRISGLLSYQDHAIETERTGDLADIKAEVEEFVATELVKRRLTA